MNHKNTIDKRPYLCPGCEIPLDTEPTAAVAHMASCEPLQQMIAITRYAHELRNKAVEARQVKTK